MHFLWKCLYLKKNWCTGELPSHRCSGEMISPVFHRCTSVKYRTLTVAHNEKTGGGERTIGDNNRLGRRIITAFAARLHRNSLLLLLFRVAVNFITVNGALDMDSQIERLCDLALRCDLGYVRVAHYFRF